MDAGGVTLRLRVTPNAGRDRVEGFERLADGTAVLRIRVAAVPDRGKANAAVIGLLARHLGVPKSAVTLLAGEAARLKTIHIDGDATEIAAKLAIATG